MGPTTASQTLRTEKRVTRARKAPVQSARGCPASPCWSSSPRPRPRLPLPLPPSAPGSQDPKVGDSPIPTRSTTRRDASRLPATGEARPRGASVAGSPDRLVTCPPTITTITPPRKRPRPARPPRSSRMRTTTTATLIPPRTRRTLLTRPAPTGSRRRPAEEWPAQRSLALSTPPPCRHDYCTRPLTTTITTTITNSITPRSSSRGPWSWTYTNSSSRAAYQSPTL